VASESHGPRRRAPQGSGSFGPAGNECGPACSAAEQAFTPIEKEAALGFVRFFGLAAIAVLGEQRANLALERSRTAVFGARPGITPSRGRCKPSLGPLKFALTTRRVPIRRVGGNLWESGTRRAAASLGEGRVEPFRRSVRESDDRQLLTAGHEEGVVLLSVHLECAPEANS